MTVANLPSSVDADGQRIVLDGMSWKGYGLILESLEDRHIFVTYDDGCLELMSPSQKHENRSESISKLIWAVTDGLSIPTKSGGSTTFRRKDLKKGFEPDKCFWVAHEREVRFNSNIDLSIDPPPDLCVEIEISNRLLNRIAIYTAMGVPELWRDNGSRLRIFTLTRDRTYVEVDESPSFPGMTAIRLNRYLSWGTTLDEMTWARKIRRAARKHRPIT